MLLSSLFALSCLAFIDTALAEPTQSAQPTQSTQNPQPQSLHHQKTYLQEQLKDLEKNEQYQKDIETLQSKIQYLKEKQGLLPQQEVQPMQTAEPQPTQTQEMAESNDENLAQVAENEQKLPFEIEPMNKEKSGAFIGLTFGVASFTSNLDTYYHGKKGGVENRFTSSASLDKAVGIYGLMIGYKHGITGGFGLRYYADINYVPQNKIWSMNYALNIDGLLNIVEKNHNFFGFFAGVGVGAQTHGWSDRLLESMLEVAGDSAGTNGVTLQGSPSNHKGKKFSNPKTSVNVAINFGIRASLARHHDIELGVRFRPLRSTLIEEKIEPQVYSTTEKFGIQGRIGSPYDIFLRYVYVF